MSAELLYTSTPQGLRHGSRGFCTVLTTAGMPINVLSKLEAISSYRHLYPPGTQGGHNPTTYSHQRLNLAGQVVSVLSRIAAHGVDYSRRPNKIAHHITVDANEMAAGGPAWVMMQPSVMREKWLGQCETPDTGPAIPQGDQPSRICTTWRTLAGDAGWGGVVAEAISSGSSQPLWVIYPRNESDRILELVDESISLLPPAQRWQATFSTYAANIPPDVDCKIRFVPDGTEEAQFAVSGGKAIDLTKHQSIDTASIWVEKARGLVRGDSVKKVTGGTFNAVQTDTESPPIESSWSSANSNLPPEPPAAPEPPSLPQDYLTGRKRKRRLAIVATAFGILFVLGTTWVIARRSAGLPLIPGDEPLPIPPRPVLPPEDDSKPKPKSPDSQPAPSPLVTLDLKLRVDQKQLLQWASMLPTNESPLPSPVSLRGGRRLPDAVKAEKDQSISEKAAHPEKNAVLVSWGGDANAFEAPQPVQVQTTFLTEGSQVFQLERFPESPVMNDTFKLFWSRDSGDLIAFAELDGETNPADLNGFLEAYRTFGVKLGQVNVYMKSLAGEANQLPASMQNAASAILTRVQPTDQSMIKGLIRSAEAGGSLADEASQLSDSLQKKAKSGVSSLEKSEQDALLQVVSDCERLVSAWTDATRAYAVLKEGVAMDVPDIEFHNKNRNALRRVPIRLHFSW